MKKDVSIFHLEFYLAFVFWGMIFLYLISSAIYFYPGDEFVETAIIFFVRFYGFSVLVMAPLLASSILSFGIKSFNLNRSEYTKTMLRSPLRFIIWDEIINAAVENVDRKNDV